MNEIEFLSEFSSEKKCVLFFKSIIEYKGLTCRHCGSNKLKWGSKNLVWRCVKCTQKISIKSVSFMKNSKCSYQEWLHAIYFLLEPKKPISTKELQRKLGSKYYKRVYYMAMKIRYELIRINKNLDFSSYALLKKLDEFDLNDGKLHSVPAKTVLLYKKDKCVSKLRMIISKQDLKYNLKEIEHKMKDYSFIKLLNSQDKELFQMSLMKRKKYAVNRHMDLRIQHNTNRIIEGIHHGVSRFHLQAYLDEFSFKYNNRLGGYSNFLLFCENLEFGNHRHT